MSSTNDEPFRGYDMMMSNTRGPVNLVGIHVLGGDSLTVIREKELDLSIGPNTRFQNIEFIGCTIRIHGQCTFEGCNFSDGSSVNSHTGRKIRLKSCNVIRSHVAGVDEVQGGTYQSCNVYLDGGSYQAVVFENCEMGGAKQVCNRTEFSKVKFSSGEFLTSRFELCKFSDCTFWNVQFVASTFFDACKFTACKMSRWTWFTIPAQAGLTIANKLEINVSDPIESMRRNFTGVNRILHWVFLALFVAPYACFIAFQWGKHLAWPEAGRESLFSQLMKYIVSGGETNCCWQVNAPSLAIFLVYVAYNGCRAVLLWKMMQIETEERIKGVPGRMALVGSRGWRRVEMVLGFAKWIMIPLVIVNTVIFLSTKTPY